MRRVRTLFLLKSARQDAPRVALGGVAFREVQMELKLDLEPGSHRPRR